MTGNGAAEYPNDTNVVRQNWKHYHGHVNVPGPTGSSTTNVVGVVDQHFPPYNFNMGTPSWRSSSVDSAKTISEYNSTKYPSDPGGQRDEENDFVMDVRSQTENISGRKFDVDKLEYGLVPPIGFKAVVEILTIGARKYDRDNWKHVPDAKRRYFDAAMRHMWDWKSGDKYDEETSKNHLAHAICNLMFLLEKDLLTE